MVLLPAAPALTNRGHQEVHVFRKGDRVVYPHHGAAVIDDLVEREVFGKPRTYFKLRLPHGGLVIMVPVDGAEEVGLRGVVSRREVDKVFDLLHQDEGPMPLLWTQRFKSNLAKLISGDIYKVAEVVRDLSLRERRRALSPGETRMLAKAREILISELTFAIDATEENAEAMLDGILATGEDART